MGKRWRAAFTSEETISRTYVPKSGMEKKKTKPNPVAFSPGKLWGSHRLVGRCSGGAPDADVVDVPREDLQRIPTTELVVLLGGRSCPGLGA